MTSRRSRAWWVGLTIAGGLVLIVVTSLITRSLSGRRAQIDAQRDDSAKLARAPSASMDAKSSEGAVPHHAVVAVAPDVQQRIGVTVGKVEKAALQSTLRTVGIVRADETKLAHIHLKTEGWVDELFVDYTGQAVQKGAPLLSIYSPQLLVTEQDYLTARRGAASAEGAMPGGSALMSDAKTRLRLLDVPKGEIEQLERGDGARRTLTLRSPMRGTVIEKKAFPGQYVTPQDDLYVIADLSTVWVEAKIYESEISRVRVGQPAMVTGADLGTQPLRGKVMFIDPTVEETTRTVSLRVALPNPQGTLKPNMYVNVEIKEAAGDGVVVPMSAVIRTGERNLVYRVAGSDRFVPVEVKIAPASFGDKIEILAGLKPGDEVVTSANFLVDSESRLRAGGGSMAGMPGMDTPGAAKDGMKGMSMPSGGAPKGPKPTDGPHAPATSGAPTGSDEMKNMKMQ